MYHKKIILLLFACSISLNAAAQEPSSFPTIGKGTAIWQGSAALSRHTVYLPTPEKTLVPSTGRLLELDGQYVRMIARPVGAGLKASAVIIGFGGAGAQGFVIGPVLRAHLYQGETFLVYSEGFYQFGREMNAGLLGELIGGGGNRFRTGLAVGLSARVSARAGVFLRLQNLWEGEWKTTASDTRARSLSIGLELFNF